MSAYGKEKNPRSPSLRGPYPLTISQIGQAVNGSRAGVFALGSLDLDGNFVADTYGRSDSHVQARLWSHVGTRSHFMVGTCGSPEEAYLRECEMYHCVASPAPNSHPHAPAGSHGICPICGR